MAGSVKKVLIVEDDAIVAKNLSLIIEKIGFESVATISKGGKVVDAVKLYLPDIILMDILLDDDIDGITAARAVNTFSDTPVIFITTDPQPGFIDQAIKENPYGYIVKPFREVEIQYTVRLAFQKNAMIREMKNKQIEITQLKEFYDNILSSMKDWLIVINNRSEIIYSNESFHDAFNNNSIDPSFKNFTDSIFNKDTSEFINKIFSSGKNDQKEISFKNQAGGTRTYNIKVSPIPDENRIISMALVSGRDITELVEQRETLKSFKDVLDTIVQTVPAGIILTDSEGNITLTNKTFESMSGFTFSELEGKNITFLPVQSSTKIPQLTDNGGRGNYISIELELKKAGSGSFTAKILILHFNQPLNDKFTKIFFITDISFEKKLEVKQTRLQNHIESIMREMDELSELLLETNVYNQSIKQGNTGFDSVERNILKLIESGLTNNQIAVRLDIAEVTVKKRLTNLYSKLGIKNRYQLIEYLHKNFVPDK